MRYRYRFCNCSSKVMPAAKRHLWKLGTLISIQGYRYHGRYCTDHEAVLIRGTKGTARMSGVCWGYGGEGPHALRDLLLLLGVDKATADKTAFTTPRSDSHVGGPGEPKLVVDWKLHLNDGGGHSVPKPIKARWVKAPMDCSCDWCQEEWKEGTRVVQVAGHDTPNKIAVQRFTFYWFCGPKCLRRGMEPEVAEIAKVV
jgi:hypothetical protein